MPRDHDSTIFIPLISGALLGYVRCISKTRTRWPETSPTSIACCWVYLVFSAPTLKASRSWASPLFAGRATAKHDHAIIVSVSLITDIMLSLPCLFEVVER